MDNSRRKIWIAAVVCLIAAAALAVRPAYRTARAWRADALARAAEKAIEAQEWTEASQKAQAAYHLDPTGARSMRVVARLYTIAGQPNAVTFWENLRASGLATEEDRRELIRAGLRFGKAGAVRGEVFALTRERPEEAENLRLAADFCLFTGDRTNALIFSRALAKLGANPAAELTLARALVATGDPANQAQARGLLLKLAGGTNAAGLDAQVVLARAGMVSDEALPGLIEGILKHPQRKLPHRLLAEELRLKLRPQERAQAVAAFVNEASGSPLSNRVEVARWLNRQGEFGRAAELAGAGESLGNREAFLVRADALAALGKWREVQEELQQEGNPLEPALREVFLARAALELKAPQAADAHWRRAHLEVAAQPEALLYIAEYAEKVGEVEEARKAYERLAAAPEYSDRAFTGLIRIAEQTGGTRTLREIMRDLSARRPDDPAPLNDMAYLNLLLNERVEASKETALKLHAAQPNVMAFRTTLALAHLRANEVGEAKGMYEGLNLDWRALKPGWQAVHVAVVGEGGEPHLARTLARQIPLPRLKPEERLLIQPWL